MMVHLTVNSVTSVPDDPVHISVTDAKGQLTDLVRRAEAGDEIILTRHGLPAVRLVPVRSVRDPKARRALLDSVRKSAAARVMPGPDAARSQDFLYGDDGLPK
jgi:prevent-host-death family protein